ncbi:MAG: DUF4922 domain-containing protein [Pseudomonadota bacterium]
MNPERLLAEVTDADELPAALAELLDQQRATWPALREGEAALAASPMRPLADGDAALVAQANLRRSTSTFARTDAASVAARPCFLCADNLPDEERGVGFGPLVALPNPFPAVRDHLTLAAREHVPQRIAGRIELMHDVARALGEDAFVLYNGPRCGASAPDHFHFQSGRLDTMPIFEHSALRTARGLSVMYAGARNAFVVRTEAPAAAAQLVTDCLRRIAVNQPDEDEPMVNILSTYRDGHHITLLFPRTRHRPGDFFTAKNALAISPAALEMAGLVVVCDEAQYDGLSAASVERIFSEVCVSAALMREALE